MHAELVDDDGLRAQRRTNVVGARGTVTIDIVFSNMVFQQYGVFSKRDFLKQAELRSGVLERE